MPLDAAPELARFRVPPALPQRERVALLETLADEDARAPWLRALAARLPAAPVPYLAAVLAAAQGLPRVPDPPGEWFQTAAYTVRWGGDCDDLVELVVALARARGLRARVVYLPQPDAPQDHWTAQFSLSPAGAPDDAAVWDWWDPFVPGARLAEHPYVAAARAGLLSVAGIAP